MLGAERSTLFLHDDKTNELFSRVTMGPKIGEIRFPDSAGIAGAASCSPPARRSIFRTPMRICAFNPSFDKRTGFFTRLHFVYPGYQQARIDHRRDPGVE